MRNSVEFMACIVIPLWFLEIFLVFYYFGIWAGLINILITFLALGNITK